jgi:Putative zinc-finger
MTCRDLRRLADAFVARDTTADVNHDILRHLDACPSCRADLDGRRRLRAAMRGAFTRAPELQPEADFSARLRTHLQREAAGRRVSGVSRRSWLGLAAGVVLTIGLAGGLFVDRSGVAAAALAQDAVADHRICALSHRGVRMALSLPEAAARFDRRFRLLVTAPPDELSTPDGVLRVIDRHACAYDTRLFGHVIMQYRAHVVSLLMTPDGAGAGRDPIAGGDPRAIGASEPGLSVVTVEAGGHAFLLVGDLARAELARLSAIVVEPLAQRLAGGVIPTALPDLMVGLEGAWPAAPDTRRQAVSR